MFRELVRKNKQIARQECLEVLRSQTRGVLSVQGDDGYPYGMPMNHWYSDEDGCIYFHCGKSGHRLDALARCDKASLCVYEPGTRENGAWAYTVRSVIVFGRVDVIDDMDKIVDVTAKLSRKFTQNEAYISEEIAQYAHETLLLRLTPEHICGKRVVEA